LQSRIDILRTQERELRQTIADLKVEVMISKKGQRGRKRQADVDPRFNHDTVVLLGKKYSVTVAPWVDSRIFGQWPDANGLRPNAPERFDTDANFLKGAVVELHEYLGDPELCKLAVEYPAFKNAFQKQTNAERATALSSTREMAPVIFDGLTITTTLWAAAAASKRGKDNTMRNLLYFPHKPKSPFSPIFYPNQQENPGYLFKNEYQPK
ncbi:hypothetical protein MPER_15196, partial [Moniliophthora perniciosa FA553]